MLTGFPLGVEESQVAKAIFGLARWNPYVSNWPIVLHALRQLWEMGKVSELKSPFYEPFEKAKNSL
jgi:hypothetical protein